VATELQLFSVNKFRALEIGECCCSLKALLYLIFALNRRFLKVLMFLFLSIGKKIEEIVSIWEYLGQRLRMRDGKDRPKQF